MLKLTNNIQNISIDIEGYAYPFSRDDWDSNWLSVKVIVVDSSNNYYREMNDVCLLTMELVDLLNWFKYLKSDNNDTKIKFIEPCLAFFVKNKHLNLELNYNLNPNINSEVPYEISFSVYSLDLDYIISSIENYINKFPQKGHPK